MINIIFHSHYEVSAAQFNQTEIQTAPGQTLALGSLNGFFQPNIIPTFTFYILTKSLGKGAVLWQYGGSPPLGNIRHNSKLDNTKLKPDPAPMASKGLKSSAVL